MKTLKILTVVLVGALVCVLVSGMLDFEHEQDFFAEQPNPRREPEDNSDETITKAITTSNGYQIGDRVADFRLKNVDGNMVSMANYDSAKGFIIIFTCNHCPYSVAYEDRIIALDKKYKEQGYPVIAINPNDPLEHPDDSFENMKVRSKEKGFTFPYIFDDGQKVYPKYGATKTPHVFLVKKENEDLILKYKGAIDDNHRNADDVKNKFTENAVNALVSNQPIKVTESVAIGCRIK